MQTLKIEFISANQDFVANTALVQQLTKLTLKGLGSSRSMPRHGLSC
jgi:hypothetical protein